ncbi:unknown [Faecalibacterium sp. CAG:1138]|nr:unknown [Faecalibacterium sp. CAG:1138]
MTGTESRNEKSAASVFSMPKSLAAVIVLPLLDIPGKTAKPCATPVKNAFLAVKPVILSFRTSSPAAKTTAVIIKPRGRYLPIKSSGSSFLNTRPSAAVGTDART